MAPKRKLRRNNNNNSNNTVKNENKVHQSKKVNEPTIKDVEPPDQKMINSVEFDDDDTVALFRQYRFECQELLTQASSSLDNKSHIGMLERLVRDLIEQNQCLVENIAEIKHESAMRVDELHRRLQESAQRTEEVMLSLASHELHLKQFVEQHCCNCCQCDTRLMQFKMCHRDQCHERDLGMNQWNRVLCQTSNWFTNKRFYNSMECFHNLPSQIRFTNLVDQIESRINKLEFENEEIRHENGLIRELNSMLSCRDGLQLSIDSHHYADHQHISSHRQHSTEKKMVDSTIGDHVNEDLITFLGETGQTDMFADYLMESVDLRDGLDSCGGSRPDSLNDGSRLDIDSGFSTDLIPSQTDINSFIMSSSECDDELCDSQSTTSIGINRSKNETNITESSIRTRLQLAERLVPKLYNKLLYYLVQRNVLLRQLQLETKTRIKCKRDLSSLADHVTRELKDFDLDHLSQYKSINTSTS